MVVRFRLPEQTGRTGGPAYTDVLGILERFDESTLLVRRSDDTVVEIMTADLALAKRIPPPPARHRHP